VKEDERRKRRLYMEKILIYAPEAFKIEIQEGKKMA
jgi:hypothetical protein